MWTTLLPSQPMLLGYASLFAPHSLWRSPPPPTHAFFSLSNLNLHLFPSLVLPHPIPLLLCGLMHLPKPLEHASDHKLLSGPSITAYTAPPLTKLHTLVLACRLKSACSQPSMWVQRVVLFHLALLVASKDPLQLPQPKLPATPLSPHR